MRKLIVSTIFLLLICITAVGQENKWAISFTPTLVQSVVSPYPGFQLGLEYQLAQHWRMLTELTIPLKKDNPQIATEISYFRVKPEFRYALTHNESGLNYYTGLQLGYIFRKWKDPNDGCYFEEELYEDSCITYSSASISSPIITSSAQIGTLITFGRVSFDFFMGMGLRVINTSYSDIQNPGKDFSIRPNCMILFSPDPAHWVNGNITRFHFNTGIRFLYIF